MHHEFHGKVQKKKTERIFTAENVQTFTSAMFSH